MSYLNIDPTLCRGKFTHWGDYGDGWVVQPKYNGDRRLAQFCPEKTYFTGRRDGKNSGNKRDVSSCLPKLGEAAEARFHGLILDGELTVPGGNHSNVTEVVGGSAAHAVQVLSRPGHLGVLYRAFDILQEPGRDLRLYTLDYRQKALEKWVNLLQDSLVSTWAKARIRTAPTYTDPSQRGRELYEEELADGGEGVVLKLRKSKYADQRYWVKVKPWDSVTVSCTGFKMGAGKFDGLIGSLYFIDEGTGVTGSCSGMTDADRLDMTQNQERLIGGRFQLRYTGVLASGKLEHPRFGGWGA